MTAHNTKQDQALKAKKPCWRFGKVCCVHVRIFKDTPKTRQTLKGVFPLGRSPFCIKKTATMESKLALLWLKMVEARRVELLSENRSTRLSTSVAVPLRFPRSSAGQQAQDLGSFPYNHKLEANLMIVHHSSTPAPRPWYSVGRRQPLIRLRTRNYR